MKLLRNCREVTHLVLEGQDRPLSGTERVSLRLHWLVCDACRTFRRQSDTLRVALSRWQRDRDTEFDQQRPGA